MWGTASTTAFYAVSAAITSWTHLDLSTMVFKVCVVQPFPLHHHHTYVHRPSHPRGLQMVRGVGQVSVRGGTRVAELPPAAVGVTHCCRPAGHAGHANGKNTFSFHGTHITWQHCKDASVQRRRFCSHINLGCSVRWEAVFPRPGSRPAQLTHLAPHRGMDLLFALLHLQVHQQRWITNWYNHITGNQPPYSSRRPSLLLYTAKTNCAVDESRIENNLKK